MKKIYTILLICVVSSCNPSKNLPDSKYELSFCEDCIYPEDALEFEKNYGSKLIELDQIDYKHLFLRCSPASKCWYGKNDLFFIKTDSLTSFRELTHYEVSSNEKNGKSLVIEIHKKVFYRDFRFDYQQQGLYKKTFNYGQLKQLYYKLLKQYQIPKEQIYQIGEDGFLFKKLKRPDHDGFFYKENRDDYCCKNKSFLLSKKIPHIEDTSKAFRDKISDNVDEVNLEFMFTYSGNERLPGNDGYQEIPTPTPDFKNVIEEEDFGIFISIKLNREDLRIKLFD